MAGTAKDGQGDLIRWSEMPRSPGHVPRLQVLIEGGDAFGEASCRPLTQPLGAPSDSRPRGTISGCTWSTSRRIDSERGLEWRCSDSLSLRAFLRLGSRDLVPEFLMSRIRTRPPEVGRSICCSRRGGADRIASALGVMADHGGLGGAAEHRSATTAKATGRCWSAWPGKAAVETPTAESLARLDRKRKGEKLSNTDWVSKSDPEAKIAKMKDGTTHLAYKPEHAVDLDTGAVEAAELHPADEGDTTTKLSKTLAKAEANLEAVDAHRRRRTRLNVSPTKVITHGRS